MQPYSTLPTIPTFESKKNTENGTLYPNTVKPQLSSFLGPPKAFEGIQTHYNPEVRDNHYPPVTLSSPTPILLSSPYSRNNTFEQQQIHALPILNESFNRKRNDDNKRAIDDDYIDRDTENKKYRSLLLDNTSPTFNRNSSSGTDGSSSPPLPATARPKGSGRGRKPAHELLSEDQKKANHIASEQKRRANIRIGFDQLVELVPNLTECQRSESLILQKSADYIRQLVETKNDLRDRVRELQTSLGEIPDEDSSEGELDYGF